MKLITDIARYFVGVLFIFSGIVKANDPLGFSYKLEEYFEEFAKLGEYVGFLEPFFHFCHEYALPQAIFIVVLEVILGVAILVRFRTRLVAVLLLGLIIMFTILTFASWKFEIVRSCGCFGDAIPLTPFESFIKDIILLVLILIIFIRQKAISISETGINDFVLAGVGSLVMLKLSYDLEWFFPFWFTVITFTVFFLIRLVEHRKAPFFTTILATVAMSFFTFYTYSYLPVKDFRAYAAGKSISEQRFLPEDAPKDVYETILTYRNKKTGEEKDFTTENYPWNDTTNWAWVNTVSTLVQEGAKAPTQDFELTNEEGEDVTDEWLLSDEFTFFLISKSLDQAAFQPQSRINELAKTVQEKGYRFVGLTSSGLDKAADFTRTNSCPYFFLSCDEIVLKTIIRSNPGLMLIKDGKVYGKWHYNDLPEWQVLELEYLNKD